MKGNNKISSFEKLTFIDFPSLEELILSDNDITSIKCLNKINFKAENIKKVAFCNFSIILDANRVQSLEPISRVKFVNAQGKKEKSKQNHKEENIL